MLHLMHTSVNGTVGRQVARLRNLRGDLSQVGLAGLMSASLGKVIDPSTVNRLERGKRPVTADELLALCEIFEVPVTELLLEPDPIRSGQDHWRSVSRTTEAQITMVSTQLARLNREAEAVGEILEAFILLDTVRKHRDHDGLARAVELLRKNAYHLHRAAQPSGGDRRSIWAALQLAGVPRAAVDRAAKETEQQLAEWRSKDSAVNAAMWDDELLRFDLTSISKSLAGG